VLTGCSPGSVDVGAPTVTRPPCRALLDRLPDTVAGQERRAVEPADAPAAAWGDPAVVLVCGVDPPPALRPTSPCAEVNGVGWFAQERADGYRFTTVGRTVGVRLQVPYDHEPAADALVDVAASVRGAVPEVRPCV
jgi:hypothetical protein